MLTLLVAVVLLAGAAQSGYVAEPLVAAPVYGAHYGHGHYGHYAPLVKTVSSVAVAHTPVATSYSNTYKVSQPVLKVPVAYHPPLVKYSAPIIAKTYSSPYYSYGHGLYDYPYGYGHGYGHSYEYPLLYSKYIH